MGAGQEDGEVTVRAVAEAAVLVLVTAVLYGLGYEFQGWLFLFSEHVPGVSWFYLPAGLRVLFVLVAGIYGALGVFCASLVINVLYMKDIGGTVLLLTAAASGFGAWVALWVLRLGGVIEAGLSGLTAAALMKFALLYSGINALFHQLVWWFFKREGVLFWVDVWPMFVGDLLGALVFLYGLKGLLQLRKTRRAGIF